MYDPLSVAEHYWLMFTIKLSVSFFIFYRYGPIGPEESREEFIKMAQDTPQDILGLNTYISLVLSASIWYITIPLMIYDLIKYGLPEPRN